MPEPRDFARFGMFLPPKSTRMMRRRRKSSCGPRVGIGTPHEVDGGGAPGRRRVERARPVSPDIRSARIIRSPRSLRQPLEVGDEILVRQALGLPEGLEHAAPVTVDPPEDQAEDLAPL